ncbi:probable U6 snRNA-associated Sm-like protein LSm4 [Ipomoea triloba]|uniref:probable U6 snRNA-associated Sm-like protein LSm4 n=1 Tax=Ipomoea triloba TaxID=35885 RepID=UPI00125DC703|nr:probable U6 snRNA-associated Sm-like protein LSm4 [Ipomoea triloba]
MVSHKGVDRAQKSKLQSLRRLYDHCEMTSTETVDTYFTRLIDEVNKMRLYGNTIEDGAVSHKTELLLVAELKGMIESHIDKIESKSKLLAEEPLKSQVTLNMTDPNQRGGGSGRDRGRGRGGFSGRGSGSFNQRGGRGNSN